MGQLKDSVSDSIQVVLNVDWKTTDDWQSAEVRNIFPVFSETIGAAIGRLMSPL